MAQDFLIMKEKFTIYRIKSIRCINLEYFFCIFPVKHFVNGVDSFFTSDVLPYIKLNDPVVFKTFLQRIFISIFPMMHLNTSLIPAGLTSGCASKGIILHATKAIRYFILT